MNDVKIDEPHNTYKRLEEEQPDPAAMAYASQTSEFTNPMSAAYPNSNMLQPNPIALTYANPQGYPNQNAMTQPHANPMLYTNQNAMTQPNVNPTMYPNQNAMPYPNAMPMTPAPQYVKVYPGGPQNDSSYSDSDSPIHSNEPPKPLDDTMAFAVPGFDFSEQTIRKMFIRKVYAVLVSQLLITVAITAFFMYCQPIRHFMSQREIMTPVLLTACVLSFVLVIILACTELRRVAPWNFVFLVLFTITQGIMFGLVAMYSQASEVLLAFGITAVVVLALTLFAFQTKWDFTTLGGGLLASLVVLIIFGSLAAFVPYYRTMNLLYCSAGVILFSFYIIYDTQLMIGGGHKYTFSPEEYIFAALTLYLDILNLLLYILRILRAAN